MARAAYLRELLASPQTSALRYGLFTYRQTLKREPCSYCGRWPSRKKRKRARSGSRVTLDHVVALSVGGSRSWDNEAPACLGCNVSKGSRSALVFIVERGGYGEARPGHRSNPR